jgi:hypothetical protein
MNSLSMKFYTKAVRFTIVRTKTDSESHKNQQLYPYHFIEQISYINSECLLLVTFFDLGHSMIV